MSDLPERAEALFFEGNRLMAAGEAEAAEGCYRKALALVPDFSEVLSNLALLRERAGAFAEAEDCYRRAIATNPECAQNHLNLGVLLSNAKRFHEAEAVYQKALYLAPDSAPAWSNFGVLLARQKREAEAENCYRTGAGTRRLVCQGAFQSRLHLAASRTFCGRLGMPGSARLVSACRPLFHPVRAGRARTLAGKSLVIGFEAGHGDMIHFCRYAALLKAQGAARIAVVCHPALKRLFATLSGADKVFLAAR